MLKAHTNIKGHVLKVVGDNIATDDIISKPVMLSTSNLDELAKHAMERIDPEFTCKAKHGDILVAGRNFGIGPSHEQAPLALKQLGFQAIVADSFGRIFFRNCINIGLPPIECHGIFPLVLNDDTLEIDIISGMITVPRINKKFKAVPLPDFVLDIIEKGGLISYLEQKRN